MLRGAFYWCMVAEGYRRGSGRHWKSSRTNPQQFRDFRDLELAGIWENANSRAVAQDSLSPQNFVSTETAEGSFGAEQ